MRSLLSISAFVSLALLAASGCTRQIVPPSGMMGRWQGTSEIIVAWCEQDNLEFLLEISDDASVDGYAGEAKLVESRLKGNSRVLTWLGNSDYLIDANLEGTLVEAEQISRESITIFLDMEGDSLVGGFQTSGKKFGGRETMIMTGTDLVLHRMNQ